METFHTSHNRHLTRNFEQLENFSPNDLRSNAVFSGDLNGKNYPHQSSAASSEMESNVSKSRGKFSGRASDDCNSPRSATTDSDTHLMSSAYYLRRSSRNRQPVSSQSAASSSNSEKSRSDTMLPINSKLFCDTRNGASFSHKKVDCAVETFEIAGLDNVFNGSQSKRAKLKRIITSSNRTTSNGISGSSSESKNKEQDNVRCLRSSSRRGSYGSDISEEDFCKNIPKESSGSTSLKSESSIANSDKLGNSSLKSSTGKVKNYSQYDADDMEQVLRNRAIRGKSGCGKTSKNSNSPMCNSPAEKRRLSLAADGEIKEYVTEVKTKSRKRMHAASEVEISEEEVVNPKERKPVGSKHSHGSRSVADSIVQESSGFNARNEVEMEESSSEIISESSETSDSQGTTAARKGKGSGRHSKKNGTKDHRGKSSQEMRAESKYMNEMGSGSRAGSGIQDHGEDEMPAAVRRGRRRNTTDETAASSINAATSQATAATSRVTAAARRNTADEAVANRVTAAARRYTGDEAAASAVASRVTAAARRNTADEAAASAVASRVTAAARRNTADEAAASAVANRVTAAARRNTGDEAAASAVASRVTAAARRNTADEAAAYTNALLDHMAAAADRVTAAARRNMEDEVAAHSTITVAQQITAASNRATEAATRAAEAANRAFEAATRVAVAANRATAEANRDTAVINQAAAAAVSRRGQKRAVRDPGSSSQLLAAGNDGASSSAVAAAAVESRGVYSNASSSAVSSDGAHGNNQSSHIIPRRRMRLLPNYSASQTAGDLDRDPPVTSLPPLPAPRPSHRGPASSQAQPPVPPSNTLCPLRILSEAALSHSANPGIPFHRRYDSMMAGMDWYGTDEAAGRSYAAGSSAVSTEGQRSQNDPRVQQNDEPENRIGSRSRSASTATRSQSRAQPSSSQASAGVETSNESLGRARASIIIARRRARDVASSAVGRNEDDQASGQRDEQASGQRDERASGVRDGRVVVNQVGNRARIEVEMIVDASALATGSEGQARSSSPNPLVSFDGTPDRFDLIFVPFNGSNLFDQWDNDSDGSSRSAAAEPSAGGEVRRSSRRAGVVSAEERAAVTGVEDGGVQASLEAMDRNTEGLDQTQRDMLTRAMSSGNNGSDNTTRSLFNIGSGGGTGGRSVSARPSSQSSRRRHIGMIGIPLRSSRRRQFDFILPHITIRGNSDTTSTGQAEQNPTDGNTAGPAAGDRSSTLNDLFAATTRTFRELATAYGNRWRSGSSQSTSSSSQSASSSSASTSSSQPQSSSSSSQSSASSSQSASSSSESAGSSSQSSASSSSQAARSSGESSGAAGGAARVEPLGSERSITRVYIPQGVGELVPLQQQYLERVVQFLSLVNSHPVFGDANATRTDNENYETLLNLAERLGDVLPRGLSKSEIDRLYIYPYRENQPPSLKKVREEGVAVRGEGEGVAQTSCVVCLSDFVNDEWVKILPCTHEFHSDCISKWLKSNRTCPICRADSTPPAPSSEENSPSPAEVSD